MSKEMGGTAPEKMGNQPKEEKFKPFEIRQSPDGKFTANLPSATIELSDGDHGIAGWTKKEFGSREEAEAAIKESNETIAGFERESKSKKNAQ